MLSCEVARRLIAAEKPGRIVNISSTGSFHYGGNGAALYSVSKAAVNRITEVLVGGVVPLPDQRERHRSRRVPLRDDGRDDLAHRRLHPDDARKRLGEPAQLDSTLLYLCAPASECVTGTIVRVDDGQGGK